MLNIDWTPLFSVAFCFVSLQADVLVNTVCCNTKQLAKAGGLSAAFASAGGSEISEVFYIITVLHNTLYIGRHGGVWIVC